MYAWNGKHPDEYVRFKVVVGQRHWVATRTGPPEAMYGHPYHEIAHAAFGEIIGTEDIYLEVQWGGLYGAGYSMKLDESFEVEVKSRYWIS